MLREFAKKYRLRIRRDECGDTIAQGKLGQIYEYGPGRLAALITPGKPFVWAHTRKALVAAGCAIAQDGDHEGTVLFNPADEAMTRAVIRAVRARPKRMPSPGQLEALARTRQAHRIVQTPG